MNRKAVLRVLAIALAWSLVASMPALADDSAASIAAGGLVARRETRIVMAREVLQISLKKIVVDYDFRNDTAEDVTTEVAFPVPPYKNEYPDDNVSAQSFLSFKLWVDGKPIQYESEAKATLNGKDVTEILNANRIDVPTLGHFQASSEIHDPPPPVTRDFARLPRATQERLVKVGLFDEVKFGQALWTVHLQYHWTQSFPAHSTVHIRHEYSPDTGYTQLGLDAVEDFLTQLDTSHRMVSDSEGTELLAGFCVGQPFLSSLARQLHESESHAKTASDRLYTGLAYPNWVDFILTSANTWRQPIEDFTLIVERPKPEHGAKIFISFCSPANGAVEKTDVNLFQVHLTNFIPASELHIGFFEIPPARAAQPAAKK
jgi:hypothetical protein